MKEIAIASLVLPDVTGLASWFGSNRMLAVNVGIELARCKHVTVPFAGSMTELLHIGARSLVVADVHRHLMHLASVVADRRACLELYKTLKRLPFHPDVLAEAQARCLSREAAWQNYAGGLFAPPPIDLEVEVDDRVQWAVDYFVTSWMGHGGRSGTPGEFRGCLSVRYDAGGGDSNRRFRSAAHSLLQWNRFVEGRCTFQTLDFRELLSKGSDKADRGFYADPPFVEEGGGYKHPFTLADHRALAGQLNAYKRARCVVRYYANPLLDELYPRDRWTRREFSGRDQHNATGKPELLLINGPSLAQETTE